MDYGNLIHTKIQGNSQEQGIFGDCYYTNFGDSLVIVKLHPITFNCSLLMSHPQKYQQIER